MFSQQTRYKWELRDGVIRVYPLALRDTFIERLLATKIQRFSPKRGIDNFKVRNELMNLPEVRKLLKSDGLTFFAQDGPNSIHLFHHGEIDVSGFNTDLRGILNKIAKESVHKLWMVEKTDKRFVGVSF
jgi:hypothetical protein